MKHRLMIINKEEDRISEAFGVDHDDFDMDTLCSKMVEALVVGGFREDGIDFSEAALEVLRKFDTDFDAKTSNHHFLIGVALGMALKKSRQVQEILTGGKRSNHPLAD